MTSSMEQSYTINGVKVLFPCKAYATQLSMMDKVSLFKSTIPYNEI